ncbi:MAG: hypothetical protein KDD22_01930 [Bdellovibrionales bacterium]|nr:hypothetical protein [Bdellovibrionales bacterium]
MVYTCLEVCAPTADIRAETQLSCLSTTPGVDPQKIEIQEISKKSQSSDLCLENTYLGSIKKLRAFGYTVDPKGFNFGTRKKQELRYKGQTLKIELNDGPFGACKFSGSFAKDFTCSRAFATEDGIVCTYSRHEKELLIPFKDKLVGHLQKALGAKAEIQCREDLQKIDVVTKNKTLSLQMSRSTQADLIEPNLTWYDHKTRVSRLSIQSNTGNGGKNTDQLQQYDFDQSGVVTTPTNMSSTTPPRGQQILDLFPELPLILSCCQDLDCKNKFGSISKTPLTKEPVAPISN